jgi:hypothetical protein
VRDGIRRHRAALFLATLLVVSAVIGQAVAERTRDREGPPLTSTDTHPGGALALALWLERLGHPVQRIDQSGGSLDDVGVLFVLLPVRAFDRGEAAALVSWVRRGGVLVYLPYPNFSSSLIEGAPSDPLENELQVDLRVVPYTPSASGVGPFFTAPPASSFRVDTRWALNTRGEEWVPLVQQGDRIFVASRQIGEGRVYAVAAEDLFSNASIAAGDNAAFVLNVLARIPARTTVAFEEAHHRQIDAPDLLSVMRVSPWGWAVAYAAFLTFGFLAWGGRRFGPPVVADRLPPRSSGEYISAFAGLLQRARATDWLQKRYAALVRRRIATRLGVRADLAAEELARLLAERHPIDRAALAADLALLDGAPLSERALLTLVRSIEEALRIGQR